MTHAFNPSREEIGDPWEKFEAYRKRKLAAQRPVPVVMPIKIARPEPTPKPQPKPQPKAEVLVIENVQAIAEPAPAPVRDIIYVQTPAKKLTVEDCIRYVSAVRGIPVNDLMSSHLRSRIFCEPRNEAMYLARIYTLKSFPLIGRDFNGMDHSSVIHAVRKFEKRVQAGEYVPPSVSEIEFVSSRVHNTGAGE